MVPWGHAPTCCHIAGCPFTHWTPVIDFTAKIIIEYTWSNNSTFPLRNASFRKPEFRWENPGGGCTTLSGIGTFGLQEDIATNPSGISQNKHNIAQQYSERINFTSVCSLESQQVLEQGYESTGSPLPTFPQPSTVEPRHPPPPPASSSPWSSLRMRVRKGKQIDNLNESYF